MSRQFLKSRRGSTWMLLTLSLCVLISGVSAHADSTYSYTGNPMQDPPFAGFNCPAPCSVTGTVTLSSQLSVNQSFTSFSPLSWDLEVNNGLYLFSDADSTGVFDFQTDNTGMIDFWRVDLRLNTPLLSNGASGLQYLNSENLPPSGGGGDVLGSQPSGVYLEGNHNNPGTWQGSSIVPEPSSILLVGTGIAAAIRLRGRTTS